MTIEFADEPGVDTAPADARRPRAALPWLLPVALAAAALFLPVTTALYEVGDRGPLPSTFRVDLYPFGRVHVSGIERETALGASYGWVWVGVLVAFVVAGVLAWRRADTVWPGVTGAIGGAAGIGAVVTLLLGQGAGGAQRANDQHLGLGSWLTLAAGVVGLLLGLEVVRRAARGPVSRRRPERTPAGS